MSESIKLYGYWRSSASYRVRICLNLKKLSYISLPVNLLEKEHKAREFHQQNPSELLPVLVDGEVCLNQSLAIIQYLDEQYLNTPLIPQSVFLRYRALALAQDIAIEMHPLNNLRVLQYLEGSLNCDADQKVNWIHHWMHQGFSAVEEKLCRPKGLHEQNLRPIYSLGDEPCIVDACLVPQVYNAVRFGIEMSDYPTINAIVEACNQHPAFIDAMPENQSDAKLVTK